MKPERDPPPEPFSYHRLVVAIACALGLRPAHERYYGIEWIFEDVDNG